MRGQVYFLNYEINIQTQEIVDFLNERQNSNVHFSEVEDVVNAEYAILLIGNDIKETLPPVKECEALLEQQAHIIILVNKELFESYEQCRKVPKDADINRPIYKIIQMFNEDNRRRRWIYAYQSIKEINNIIGTVILSEYYDVIFLKQIVEVRPGDCFQNFLLFRNKGYVELKDYYIDGFFSHKAGKHRPILKDFNPLLQKVLPDKETYIPFEFLAPDIAGTFIFYAIISKPGRKLKMEDCTISFVIHVTNTIDTKGYDALLIEEYPENGKLYTKKDCFLKTWKLKNISGEDWKKVIFKVKYEHLTHYFCMERKKVFPAVLAGEEFTINANFYPPDIPGKYTAFWQLLREDGSEIRTDGPICCSVVTQYATLSQFEMCD